MYARSFIKGHSAVNVSLDHQSGASKEFTNTSRL
jgi:hypothetical protein